MAESYGWAGKILRVDLTTGEITTQDDAKYHKYIGGMGMAYRIMYEEAPMDSTPTTRRHRSSSASAPDRCRCALLRPHERHLPLHLVQGQLHHRRPHGRPHRPHAEVCGLGRIVITGISAKPVYLRIEDDEVSLEDASDIWGKGTFASNKWMVEQNGREFETASIGLPVRIWWTTPPEHQLWQLRRRRSGRCHGQQEAEGPGHPRHRQRQGGRPQKGAGAVQLHDGQPHRRQQQPQCPRTAPELGRVQRHLRQEPLVRRTGPYVEKGSRRPRGYRRAAYNDINKIALRCFKGYFDFGAPAAEYTVKNGGCSSCPIRCYTEYDVDPLADYDLPTHNSNTCMPVPVRHPRLPGRRPRLQVRGRRHHGHQPGMGSRRR